jgi:hypothetical protein
VVRTTIFCVLCVGLSSQICEAQALPVQNNWSNVTEARVWNVSESSAASSVRLTSPSPKPMGKSGLPKVFLLTSTGVYSAAVLDMRNTRNNMNFCVGRPGYVCSENNPLARPFVNLPAGGYYASGLVLATGINWLSWKMTRIEKLRHVWFLPQLASMAANGWGYASSARISSASSGRPEYGEACAYLARGLGRDCRCPAAKK